MESNDRKNIKNPKSKSVTTVSAKNNEQIAKIFKLNVDCFEEIFDFLSVGDLMTISRTCKRLQKIGGNFFRSTYSGFTMIYYDSRVSDYNDRMRCLIQFCQKVRVVDNKFEYKLPCLRDVQSKCYKSLKRIEFKNLKINSTEGIEYMADVLAKVESIEFHFCEIECEVYEAIMDHCKNLKNLQLLGCRSYAKSALSIEYPLLEHFEFKPIITDETLNELRDFFELNPNIRKFTIDSQFLRINWNSLLNLDVKLDILTITFNAREDLNTICDKLEKLYEHEFFKQLHFECKLSLSQVEFDRVSSLESLTKLNVLVSYMPEIVNLPILKNLEEFSVYDSDRITGWMKITQNLPNLRRISLSRLSCDIMFHLIGNSVKLNSIVIDHFVRDGKQCKKGIIDLEELNKQRLKLKGAHVCTIYIGEDSYLATKWKLKHKEFEMVKMKRIDSFK